MDWSCTKQKWNWCVWADLHFKKKIKAQTENESPNLLTLTSQARKKKHLYLNKLAACLSLCSAEREKKKSQTWLRFVFWTKRHSCSNWKETHTASSCLAQACIVDLDTTISSCRRCMQLLKCVYENLHAANFELVIDWCSHDCFDTWHTVCYICSSVYSVFPMDLQFKGSLWPSVQFLGGQFAILEGPKKTLLL